MRLSWRRGTKGVIVTGQVVGSIPTRENVIYLIFIYFALVRRQNTAMSSATQHAITSRIWQKCEDRKYINGNGVS